MELSKRLSRIVALVDENKTVADIGTDHGYIPIYLIKNKISKKVIASDVSSGSLKKTRENVANYLMEDYIDIRLGDGLKVLKKEEVDIGIIAGMGGVLISEILEESKELARSLESLIVQPMIAGEELRKYLINNNYEILDEELVKDRGKFYEIIKVSYNKSYKNTSFNKEIDYLISPILIEKKHELLADFIQYKIDYEKDILKKLESNSSINSKIRYNEVRKRIKEYEEVLNL